MTPDEYCADKASRSGSSFTASFRWLPDDQRRAITALYAFCREVDDVVDESSDETLARTRLAWWRTEIARLDEGSPQHPVTRALAPHGPRFGIDTGRLNEIIDGMQMDLDQNRYLDFTGLRLYCHRVAGVVGTLSADIFGAGPTGLTDYAENLGCALQLTNIIRDVGEDARRGRIYLPLEDLRAHSVGVQDLLAGRSSSGLVDCLRQQARRARGYYRDAFSALPRKAWRAQRPGLVMAAVYLAVLDEIERDGFQVLRHRIVLPPARKLWLAGSTWLRARPPRIPAP